MTPAEFRAALKALGMTSGAYARLSNRPLRTVYNWTDKQQTPVPQAVAEWLRRRVEQQQKDPPP